VVDNTLIALKDLGSSPMYAYCVLVKLLFFLTISTTMLSDNIIIELY